MRHSKSKKQVKVANNETTYNILDQLNERLDTNPSNRLRRSMLLTQLDSLHMRTPIEPDILSNPVDLIREDRER